MDYSSLRHGADIVQHSQEKCCSIVDLLLLFSHFLYQKEDNEHVCSRECNVSLSLDIDPAMLCKHKWNLLSLTHVNNTIQFASCSE